MEPKKYFQIQTPGTDGVLRPLEVNQYGESDSFFDTEEEAELFIRQTFADAQSPEMNPDDKTDLVLIVLPVFCVRFIAVLLLLMLMACGSEKKGEKYIVSGLPKGVKVYGFNEQYDKPYGRYELHFFLKNETGKKIEYPQIDGDLFLNGELEGKVTGGLAEHLNNLDSGVISFSYIMPKQVPDSVVFKFVN